MTNRLAEETSPYLLQHKDNPVDWNPWGAEALAEAKRLDKPILLSVGYSSCHWCHVMERESFEDESTAELMNERFVCVKVDREERPDIDSLYMEAVQSMTGQGGWPLTVFCDADGVPFYGGTYFPPEARGGIPSFKDVLVAIADAYADRREEIAETANAVRDRLAASGRLGSEGGEPTIAPSLLDSAQATLISSLDRVNGGFGGAPKFPPSGALEFLMSRGEREATELTLDGMLHGGIFDQVGGGFARYSVDERWLIPHFEKMLYDNALLARCYLHGWQWLGHERWRQACELTLGWMLDEMRGPEGGFYSALDADSSGEEGLFYVWDEAEARQALAEGGLEADEVEQVLGYWGASPAGNFEGRNVLHVAAGAAASPPPAIEEARSALLARRARRERPGLDDKRICSWNALAISALADAGAALGREDLLEAARECADFVLGELRDSDGHLLRTWKDGRASFNAYLEDHAFLLEALLDLHAATFEQRWFTEARVLADAIRERFEDTDRGGFFSTSHDHEQLIARRKEFSDSPIPSATSSASLGFLRLAALSGERSYEESAVAAMTPLAAAAGRHPESFGHMLQALGFLLAPPREVAIVRPSADTDSGALGQLVGSRYLPNVAVGGGAEGSEEPPLVAERKAQGARPTAYICERFACRAPIDDPAELAAALDELGPPAAN